MVNFNNETTVGVPAVDVVRILILQRRADLIDAIEHYRKQDFNGVGSSLALVRSRLFSLFLELQGALKRKLPPKVYENLLFNVTNKNKIGDIENLFYELNQYLDSINLIKIDNKKEYDKSSFEMDNKENGLK